MTKDGQHALALGGILAAAALAALLITGGGVVRFSAQADAATDQASWSEDDYGPGYEHLCQPGGMRDRLHHGHPLFSRPAALGGKRAAVVGNGWAWFADGPSEEDL